MATKKRRGVPTAADILPEVEATRDKLIVDLRREEARSKALGDLAAAADALLVIGHADEARVILTCARRVVVDALRDRISREPGGVMWARESRGRQ